MEAIAELITSTLLARMKEKPPEERTRLIERLKTVYTESISKTPEERLQSQVDAYNRLRYEPTLDQDDRESAEQRADDHFAGVIDCDKCGNKAEIAFVKDGGYAQRPCECRAKRVNIIRLENSGLLGMMGDCTFDKYQTDTEFRQKIKQKAQEFVEASGGRPKAWFYIGGQPGCGKTHICTAIVGALIERGYSAKYMMYRDEATYLKGLVARSPEEYADKVGLLKSVDALYIDDLFKTKNAGDGRDAATATAGDVNLMFEVINARYNDREKITVISSEKSIDDIVDIDEGIGSRISQRSRGFAFNVKADRDKNWRLKTWE